MERLTITQRHRGELQKYGLQNIPEKFCTCLRFSSGERITQEGSPIMLLLVVIEGRAKVCRTSLNGKDLILCYYISDGLIGEIELLTQQTEAVCTVIAISDFECVAIKYQTCMSEETLLLYTAEFS